MPFLGFVLIMGGVWLIDSAVKNRSPIATLKLLIQNPSGLKTTLASSAGTGYATGTTATAQPATYTPPGGSGTGATASGSAATVLAFARAQIGKPYRWAASGPDAFDCSGLTMAAYKTVGINLPHYTGAQVLRGSKVNKADLQPGDLVFPDPGHVQIYSGAGMVVEAPHTGLNVREVPMWGFWTARRILTVAATTPSTGQTV